MPSRSFAGAALALGLLGSAAFAETEPRAPQSPRNASYAIEARLDVATRLLEGSEVVTWRNVTSHPTAEMPLHLYFNAWRNERSSFLRAARRSGRVPSVREYGPRDWGYADVLSVKRLPSAGRPADAVPLATHFVQPQDGNEDDRTLLQVTLPEPVPPGGTVRLEVEWRLKVPRPFARAGVVGEYYLMGHWFPKVGVFEPEGVWNARQFIQTEFYADFGTYDVALTVPAGWIVGATGTLVSAAPAGDGATTHRYRAEDVHDFAWTASPHFRVYEDRLTSPGLPAVDIELLLLPDHLGLKDRYFASAKAAFELYGKWFRPYAWDRLTIVDPPAESETGGMEYPMFVTAESRWPTLRGNTLAEANTIHEIGHQWWQGAVASNEFEDAWLDEALNTHSHKRILEQIYPPSIFEKRYFHDFLPYAFKDVPRAQPHHGADGFDVMRSALLLDSMATPSDRNDERTYYLLPYTKGSLMLQTLERHLGWDTMRRILATFADRYWFKHPRPADFFAVANEASGQDLGWFFDQAYRGTEVFDYAVDRVASRPVRSPRGYPSDGGDPPQWQAGGTTTGPALVESTVDVRRWGGGIFPVEVRVTFDDGGVAEERWDGRALWTRFRYLKPTAVRTVEVDPRRVLVLDVSSVNNSWTSRPNAGTASLKWTSKWTIWLQSLLEFAAFFS